MLMRHEDAELKCRQPAQHVLHFGLNQGPIVLMIENHRSGLLWRLMRATTGLLRAGFTGGWLQDKVATEPATANGSIPSSRRTT